MEPEFKSGIRRIKLQLKQAFKTTYQAISVAASTALDSRRSTDKPNNNFVKHSKVTLAAQSLRIALAKQADTLRKPVPPRNPQFQRFKSGESERRPTTLSDLSLAADAKR